MQITKTIEEDWFLQTGNKLDDRQIAVLISCHIGHARCIANPEYHVYKMHVSLKTIYCTDTKELR